MKNENIFRARKSARGIGKSGTLPTGSHAPKPKRQFKSHQNPSEKERKYQRSIARSKVDQRRNHRPPEIDYIAARERWGI